MRVWVLVSSIGKLSSHQIERAIIVEWISISIIKRKNTKHQPSMSIMENMRLEQLQEIQHSRMVEIGFKASRVTV